MTIVHCASSDKNPFDIMEFRDHIVHAGRYHEYYRQVGEPRTGAVENDFLWKSHIFLKETLPAKLLETYGLVTGNENL